MVELRILTNDYLYRKVHSGGRVNVKELENKKVKIIPVPYNCKPVATNDGLYDYIKLTANEVINKEITNIKRNVYISPLYQGADVLIVPATAKVCIKKPKKSFTRKTTKVSNARELVLSTAFRHQIISIYQTRNRYDEWINIDELYMKATALKGTNHSHVYLPSKLGDEQVEVFIDELYEY